MTTVLLTFALIALVMLVMAIGVLVSGRSLRGSCGGPSCQCRNDGKPLHSCDSPTLPVHD